MFLPRTIAANPIRRPVGATHSVVQFPADFTYLGAFRLPRNVAEGESVYGRGMTFRRVPADGTQPRHLLGTVSGGTYPKFGVYEVRTATPTVPGGAADDPANYPLATTVAEYNQTPYVRADAVNLMTTDFLDGATGIYWDHASDKLYWTWTLGYTFDPGPAGGVFGYSTLDLGTATGVGYGPYSLTNQSHKAIGAGLVGVPATYAASHLGGNPIALGFGGYYSIIGTGDVSLGPSLTSIPSPVGEASDTELVGLPLVGYWPHAASPGAGKGRCVRPESQVDTDFTPTDQAWGVGDWDWNDRVRAGVWIHTATKKGVVFFGEYGRNLTQYLSSQIPSSFWGHYYAVYDPDDFTPASTTPRYDIQPTEIANFQFPVVDYTPYAAGTLKTVAGITSNNAKTFSAADGCLVQCTGHGFTDGQWIRIRGSEVSQYNGLWEVNEPPDADSFYIRNSATETNWVGTAASAGGMDAALINSTIDAIYGAAWDAEDEILYVAVSRVYGVNNLSGAVLVMAYQLNG